MTSSPINRLGISVLLIVFSFASISFTELSTSSFVIGLVSQALCIPRNSFWRSNLSRFPSFLTTIKLTVSTLSKVVNLFLQLRHSRLLLVMSPESLLSVTLVSRAPQYVHFIELSQMGDFLFVLKDNFK